MTVSVLVGFSEDVNVSFLVRSSVCDIDSLNDNVCVDDRVALGVFTGVIRMVDVANRRSEQVDSVAEGDDDFSMELVGEDESAIELL